MKKKHIIFSIIFLVILLSSVGFYFLKKNLDSAKTKKMELYTINSGEKIFVNGVITPEKAEDIYLDASKGTVNKVSVQNGQAVKKGDVLFTYKNDVVTDQIAQVNRQITASKDQKKQLVAKQDEAKKQMLAKQEEAKKNQALLAGTDGSIAASTTLTMESQVSAIKDQIDSIQLQLDTYQSQLKALKEKEYTTVTAPIDGKVILHDSKSNGAAPYITIETASFYIKGSINEKQQHKLKENQGAEILILSTNKVVNGKVTSIGNRPTSGDLTAKAVTGGDSNISYYDVNIAFDSQENLTNGFHVQSTIKLAEESIKIPKSSIIKENDKSYVFKDVDKKLTKQEITYTESDSKEVVVNSGLKEKDTIVTNPTGEMKEGNPIE